MSIRWQPAILSVIAGIGALAALPNAAQGSVEPAVDRPAEVAQIGFDRLFLAGVAGVGSNAGKTPTGTADGRSDPLGDVVGLDGNQTVEPRTDISNISLRYGADRLDISVTVPGGVDPSTSPNWRNNLSALAVAMDVNGDDVPDFGSGLVSDKDGKLLVFTFSVPPNTDPRRPPPFELCGSGSYDPATRIYRLSIPSACIGNAYEVRAAAALIFNRATSISESIDLTLDLAPGGADLPAVHRDTVKNGAGYRFVASDGGIFSFGNASFQGSTGNIALTRPIVGMDSTRTGQGYWLVASDGGIFAFGDAGFFGSTGNIQLNQPITAMAATPTGQGYWLLARDGGIFAFGDAAFFGSASGSSSPFVAMAATPSGHGYWLATADGFVSSFGDARSLSGSDFGKTLVGITATPSGRGYWLAFSNGSVSARGDAVSLGDAQFLQLRAPVVGLAATPTGRGYWLLGRDGGVFSFGDAAFHGSTGNLTLNQPVLGLSV